MGYFSNQRYAFCRGIANHAWKFPPEFSHEGKRLVLTLTCANCTSTRVDRVAQSTGEVETRAYHYADGYSLKLGGGERPAKDVLRKEGLGLLLDGRNVAEVHTLKPRRHARRRVA